jgi:hypothetical protein
MRGGSGDPARKNALRACAVVGEQPTAVRVQGQLPSYGAAWSRRTARSLALRERQLISGPKGSGRLETRAGHHRNARRLRSRRAMKRAPEYEKK